MKDADNLNTSGGKIYWKKYDHWGKNLRTLNGLNWHRVESNVGL
jgi:hypothetical protein